MATLEANGGAVMKMLSPLEPAPYAMTSGKYGYRYLRVLCANGKILQKWGIQREGSEKIEWRPGYKATGRKLKAGVTPEEWAKTSIIKGWTTF